MNNFNVFLHTPAHTYIVVYLNHRIKLLNLLAEAKNSALRIAIVIVFVLKIFWVLKSMVNLAWKEAFNSKLYLI